MPCDVPDMLPAKGCNSSHGPRLSGSPCRGSIARWPSSPQHEKHSKECSAGPGGASGQAEGSGGGQAAAAATSTAARSTSPEAALAG